MRERYPYLRLITDADNIVAGLIALLVFLAGTMSGCRMGGFAGIVSILVVAALAWIVYIAVMARAEAIRALLQIESDLSELLAHSRAATAKPNESESA